MLRTDIAIASMTTAILSKQSKWGIFRTGIWYDWSVQTTPDRTIQFPSNPITWVDTPLSNFHEHFLTQSIQPFAEYEWHPIQKFVVIAGMKDAAYQMYLNQYQDGKTVGCLPGKPVAATNTVPANCPNGGAAFTTHGITYNNWLPNVSARYYLKNNWSAYAQFGEGSIIPPSNVFDVTGGIVLTPPKPTVAKIISDRYRDEVPPLDAGRRLFLHSLPERLRHVHRSDDS